MALARRVIDVTFQLGEGNFGEGNGNAVKLSGLRVSCSIIKAGGNSMGTASLQIYGMTLEKMNKLSTLGMVPTTVRKNTIIIAAGDEGGATSVVFVGNITNAWADFSRMPEVPFQVLAHVGGFEAVNPGQPTSFKGAVDVATLLSGLANQMNKKFENNGVNVKLTNPYYTGSLRDQAMAIVNDAGIQWNGLDDDKLAIWPAGKTRDGLVPLISKDTGMVGSPSFTSVGILVKTLFNPAINGLGQKIKVKSFLEPACGDWVVYALEYNLDARVPQGQWFSMISAARPGYAVVR